MRETARYGIFSSMNERVHKNIEHRYGTLASFSKMKTLLMEEQRFDFNNCWRSDYICRLVSAMF